MAQVQSHASVRDREELEVLAIGLPARELLSLLGGGFGGLMDPGNAFSSLTGSSVAAAQSGQMDPVLQSTSGLTGLVGP